MLPLREGTVELRPFNESDAPAFVDAVLESQATLSEWMPWAHPSYSVAEAVAWFQSCHSSLASKAAYEFGIFHASTGILLGGAGLNQFSAVNNFCNLGYWVRQSAQRQGVATSATRALLRFGFSHLKLTRIEVVIAEPNLPSLAVALRAGGTKECLAANRLVIRGSPLAAHVVSFLPAEA